VAARQAQPEFPMHEVLKFIYSHNFRYTEGRTGEIRVWMALLKLLLLLKVLLLMKSDKKQ
jgi:hypothetical protein